MTNLLEHEPTKIVGQFPADTTTVPVLDAISARHTLRVCFAQPQLPFVFRNGRNDLVGFDIELAHLLARDLGVQVEFAEWPAAQLADAVSDGHCDLGVGGNPITPQLAIRALYSEPYLDETVAFVVKDHLRDRFETWSSIQQSRDLTIGVPPLPYYEQLLRARLPGVNLKRFELGADPLSDAMGFDAVALPAERGSVLTMLNPQWTVVIPQPGLIKVPLAFPLPHHDLEWATFVNTWIELKRRDASLDGLYSHWILGKSVAGTVDPSVVRHP